MSTAPHPRLPRIGLTTEVLAPPLYEGKRRYQLFTDYADAIRVAGGVPILIPGDAGSDELASLLDCLDGLLLTGGDDADLRLLGGADPAPECKLMPPEQQACVFSIFQQATARRMPIFGICLGMQVMGLAFKAPYVQHLETAQTHTCGQKHKVAPSANSLLSSICGDDAFEIMSYHHQALSSAGDQGLLATAVAETDGTLEAVELPDYPFGLGVQWHPEKTPDSPSTLALFCRFVEAAATFHGAKVS
mgnify:CR=1 FL=1